MFEDTGAACRRSRSSSFLSLFQIRRSGGTGPRTFDRLSDRQGSQWCDQCPQHRGERHDHHGRIAQSRQPSSASITNHARRVKDDSSRVRRRLEESFCNVERKDRAKESFFLNCQAYICDNIDYAGRYCDTVQPTAHTQINGKNINR